MFSPSKYFECRWQPSRRLLEVYCCVQALALCSLLLIELPAWALLLGIVCCALHATWVLPRHVLLRSASAFRALRYDEDGWQVRREGQDWQPVTLMPDSMALPFLVIVRFRLANQSRVRTLCIAADSLAPEIHRRLRVRLKFSRQRWRVAE